jgi:tetratricopeptide (TPR) repeat protein
VFGRIFRWGGSDTYARGIAAYNVGHLEVALECFEAVLSRHDDPSHPDVTLASFYRAEAHRRLAAQCLESTDFRSALEHLDVAVADQPGYPDLHLRRGVIQLELEDHLAAEESARRALERNGAFVEAGLLLVLALDAQGATGRRDNERALWHARAQSEGHPLADVFAAPSPARSSLREHLRWVHRRRERVVMAESYQRQGLYAEARRLLTELVDENPAYPDLRVRLATAEFALGEPLEARRHVDAALAANPAFDEARLLDAVLSLWVGEMATSDTQLQPLLDRPRVGASARYALAVRNLLVGRPRAAHDLLRGVSANEDRVESLEALDAAIEALLGHDARSSDLYRDLLHPGVSDEIVLDAMSFALNRGNLELARRARELLPANSGRPEVLVARAHVHCLEGALDTAVDLLESATSQNPGSGAVLFALAVLYMDQGEYTAAARRLVALEVSGRDLEEVRVRHASCLRHDGEVADALNTLDGVATTAVPAADRAIEKLYASRLLQRGREAQALWELREEVLPLEHSWRVQSARRWLWPLVARDTAGSQTQRVSTETPVSREPVGP